MIPDLSPLRWVATEFSGLFVGLSKVGVPGLGLLFVPLMAFAFGAKASTGVLLPLLNAGDVMAVSLYRRHADLSQVLRLLPWAVVGLVIGTVVGGALPDVVFRRLMGWLVLGLVVLMVILDWRRDTMPVPTFWGFSAAAGLLAGFTTMVGNAAGPVMSLYLLSMRLPKTAFIGTGAWFFLTVNLIKVPLQVVFWHTIDATSLVIDLWTLPALAAGAWIGLRIVGALPERPFQILVIALTVVTGIALLL